MSYHKLQDNRIVIDFGKLSHADFQSDINDIFSRRVSLIAPLRSINFNETHEEYIDVIMDTINDIFDADLKCVFAKHGITMTT
jgi:hypothetical protein